MLIPSVRHRVEDLAIWKELEEADRLQYSFRRLDAKVHRSREIIRDFANDGPCVVMSSWGKDATVVASLAASFSIPVVHISQPDSDPTCEADEVANLFLERFPHADYHVVRVHKTGQPFVPGKPTPELLAGIEQCRQRWGSRWINGLRRE